MQVVPAMLLTPASLPDVLNTRTIEADPRTHPLFRGDLPTGSYIIMLSGEGRSVTKMMVLE